MRALAAVHVPVGFNTDTRNVSARTSLIDVPTQTHPVAFLLGVFVDVSLSVATTISVLILWRVAVGPLDVVESVVCVVVGVIGYVYARGLVLPRGLFVSREPETGARERPPP